MIHLINDYYLDANNKFYQIKQLIKGEGFPDGYKLVDNFSEVKDALRYVMDIAIKNYIGNYPDYGKKEIDKLADKVKEIMELYTHTYEVFYALEGGKKK